MKDKLKSLMYLGMLKAYFERQVKPEYDPELSSNIDLVNALIEIIKEG